MTEPTPLAPSTAEAVAATERLAVWVIGALTAIVIGGVALVIVAPHGGHAGGSSWLPEINASLNGTAAILLSTGYVLIRRRRIAAHRACMIAAFAIYAAFFFDPGGRPGPRLRLRRRRRPFFAFGLLLETLPSNDRIAELTSC